MRGDLVTGSRRLFQRVAYVPRRRAIQDVKREQERVWVQESKHQGGVGERERVCRARQRVAGNTGRVCNNGREGLASEGHNGGKQEGLHGTGGVATGDGSPTRTMSVWRDSYMSFDASLDTSGHLIASLTEPCNFSCP